MRLTKLEHAAMVFEVSGKRLYLDPGSFTTPITDATGAVAIVVTHQHPDHWTAEQLNRILDKSPGIPIYGPQGFANAADGFEVSVVHGGDTITIDPFTLRFFGGRHAVIHPSIPMVDNVGVLVNDRVYYPGDSFTIPDVEVDTLAVPASAPWLKISEVMDFVADIGPRRAFPVHEMLLSQLGKNLHYDRIRASLPDGAEFFPLQPQETLDL